MSGVGKLLRKAWKSEAARIVFALMLVAIAAGIFQYYRSERIAKEQGDSCAYKYQVCKGGTCIYANDYSFERGCVYAEDVMGSSIETKFCGDYDIRDNPYYAPETDFCYYRGR